MRDVNHLRAEADVGDAAEPEHAARERRPRDPHFSVGPIGLGGQRHQPRERRNRVALKLEIRIDDVVLDAPRARRQSRANELLGVRMAQVLAGDRVHLFETRHAEVAERGHSFVAIAQRGGHAHHVDENPLPAVLFRTAPQQLDSSVGRARKVERRFDRVGAGQDVIAQALGAEWGEAGDDGLELAGDLLEVAGLVQIDEKIAGLTADGFSDSSVSTSSA